MAITYKATFRPEKRKYKETGELIETNVPLMLDLSYQGRCWYNTGIRLQNIDDFDVEKQKMKSGKKALKNKQLISATNINNDLDNIKGYISSAYNSAQALKVKITAKFLINELQILSGNKKVDEIKEEYWYDDFLNVIENWYKSSIIRDKRYTHYLGSLNILNRFLKINKLTKLKTKDVDADIIRNLHRFVINECDYIDEHPEIYDQLEGKKRIKSKKRTQNTVANIISGFNTFFKELEEIDKINVNPFNKIPKRERELMFREIYDEPTYLSLDELLIIIGKECPEDLQRVKDSFLLHCAIGCRVEDFNNLTWEHIRKDKGFYYIHYAADKTNHGRSLILQETPLVKFSKDIIEKYKDILPNNLLTPNFRGNVTGKDGYNKQIKKLLEYYNIHRTVIKRDDNGEKKLVPISSIASSKLARSTHIDIIAKNDLNKYASGQHKKGSKAVNRYTGLTIIEEKFKLFSQAFHQPEYTIKEDNE